MDAVIPWARLIKLIEPHYPKAGNGRQPLGLEKMPLIYFLQQWFDLSEPQAEDAIYDSESMRFAKVELGAGTLAHPGPRRARLPGTQAVVGLHQGQISRPGQEPRPRPDHVRSRQPLPSPASIASRAAELRVVNLLLGATIQAPDRFQAATNLARRRSCSS
jgi:hypothetical protein